MDTNDEAVVFPEDVSALSAEEIAALHTRALAEFEDLSEQDDPDVERLEVLADGMEALDARRVALEAETVAAEAETVAAEARTTSLERTRDRVAKLRPPAPTVAPAEPEATTATTAEPERPAARGASLAAAQATAPGVPAGAVTTQPRSLAIVAAAASSGLQIGSSIANLDTLVAAVQSQARGLPITKGAPGFQMVASLENDFEHVIDGEGTRPGEIEDLKRSLLDPEKIDSLVAAGGWCAPSEVRYDFFNIACEDGMVDLPTFGVRRGGVTWPVSPSMADVFTGTFTNATNPWLWTEADDILAVTGAPTKPCVRVPCPDYAEARLECYGICLTAGNLTDSAFPESTRNYLRLLMSAHYHAMNQRYIQQMVALSTAAISIPTGSCRAISTDLPDIVGLAAQDYRTRYGMCDTDVLEVVLPRWARDAIRSDLSRRTGVDPTTFSNADIDRLFTTRRVRLQWVADWQIRTAGQPGGADALLAWPDTVDFMIYAAGTFMRGNGMSLDLGVVRDSVLNATNDHTAAWTEECHLIAMMGHQSRLYRLPVCVGGLTGGTCTECHVA